MRRNGSLLAGGVVLAAVVLGWIITVSQEPAPGGDQAARLDVEQAAKAADVINEAAPFEVFRIVAFQDDGQEDGRLVFGPELRVVYGAAIEPESFRLWLDGREISDRFGVAPNRRQTVAMPELSELGSYSLTYEVAALLNSPWEGAHYRHEVMLRRVAEQPETFPRAVVFPGAVAPPVIMPEAVAR